MSAPSRLAAITFDFWNTLYSADGGALDTVRPLRMQALREVLALGRAHPSDDELEQAYRAGFDLYVDAWSNGRHYGARDQVLHFLEYFRVDVATLSEDTVVQTATRIENASLQGDLHLIPGVHETIPALDGLGYRLGLISDTSLTPGRLLRRFLEKDGLLDYFSALTFSDETGYPKPDRRMFDGTLAKLETEAARTAHVGDTPRTDIAGAQAMGMTAIRCAAAIDNEEPPPADFVIRDHRELPPILENLS